MSDDAQVDTDWEDGRRRDVVGSPHFFLGDDGVFCPTLDITKVDGRLHIASRRSTRSSSSLHLSRSGTFSPVAAVPFVRHRIDGPNLPVERSRRWCTPVDCGDRPQMLTDALADCGVAATRPSLAGPQVATERT
jgi:hypothetical protein